MSSCLFCKIRDGQVPATIVFQDDDVVAFQDIAPRAPTHVLVIPREHVGTLNDLSATHDAMIGRLVRAGQTIARNAGIAESGYRLVLNCNADAGQSVFHVHMHVLGGRAMSWPPG